MERSARGKEYIQKGEYEFFAWCENSNSPGSISRHEIINKVSHGRWVLDTLVQNDTEIVVAAVLSHLVIPTFNSGTFTSPLTTLVSSQKKLYKQLFHFQGKTYLKGQKKG